MRRRIHTDPDTADLFQIIILCICKFSVQLFRQHPRSIEYPSGHNPVFLIELFLGFYINQKLYRLRPSPFGDICPESDVIGHGSFSRNLAFRIIPRDEEHFILLFSRSQRGIGDFNSRFDPRFYFLRRIILIFRHSSLQNTRQNLPAAQNPLYMTVILGLSPGIIQRFGNPCPSFHLFLLMQAGIQAAAPVKTASAFPAVLNVIFRQKLPECANALINKNIKMILY